MKKLEFFVILKSMQKLSESQRVSEIEQKWQGDIEKLFYNWHWNDGFTHREIANKIDLPRPTITRWFSQLQIPTQDCQRMTRRRWQIRLIKVLKLIEKQKREPFQKPCLANKHFFKSWTREMAYVLGYFAADGCMFINPRGSHFIEFTSTDRELIEKIKVLIGSKHKIGTHKHENSNWLCSYRLQVGSK
ncbi:MAG: LAGLIDADG family homing endonuclease [Candidatus Pacebacteria bacterium]|nr:LAGLIDADG family homing endonuclease [Candidatus Paceibacterota bacterium]